MTATEIPFQFVGNDISLDLVNTRVMNAGEPTDLIAEPERLEDWLKEVAGPPLADWSKKDIRALVRLRDACTQIASARMSGAMAPTEALDCINSNLEHYTNPLVLSQGDGGFTVLDAPIAATPKSFLAQIARALAALVAETEAKRLKSCAHDDCILMFKDTSKSGKRRWCSMETCGNRAKAANFRASQR